MLFFLLILFIFSCLFSIASRIVTSCTVTVAGVSRCDDAYRRITNMLDAYALDMGPLGMAKAERLEGGKAERLNLLIEPALAKALRDERLRRGEPLDRPGVSSIAREWLRLGRDESARRVANVTRRQASRDALPQPESK